MKLGSTIVQFKIWFLPQRQSKSQLLSHSHAKTNGENCRAHQNHKLPNLSSIRMGHLKGLKFSHPSLPSNNFTITHSKLKSIPRI